MNRLILALKKGISFITERMAKGLQEMYTALRQKCK